MCSTSRFSDCIFPEDAREAMKKRLVLKVNIHLETDSSY